MSGSGASRRRGGHARRAGTRFRPRLGVRLPGRGRLAAVVLLAAFVGAALLAVAGPWLRVDRVAIAGGTYTSQDRLDALMAPVRHSPLLTLDTAALRDELSRLPTVASVGVDAVLPNELKVAITEKTPAFLWETGASLLIGAGDGSIMAELPLDATLDKDLAALPRIDDARSASRELTVGDTIDPEELHIADRLLGIDPALIGSRGTHAAVRVVDEYGFLLTSGSPAWSVAFGFFGLDPQETPADEDARFDAQLTALRTLFANEDEAGISWVDVRNPGKVYWKP